MSANKDKTTKPPLDLSKLKLPEQPVGSGKEEKAPEEAPEEAVKPKKLFQSYSCSRTSLQTITDTGIKIRFAHFTFVTDVESVIEYLDTQIKLGFREVTKGDMVETTELDPMAILRAKHFVEFEEAQAKKAAELARGIHTNMGNNLPAGHQGINPMSSSGVAS